MPNVIKEINDFRSKMSDMIMADNTIETVKAKLNFEVLPTDWHFNCLFLILLENEVTIN
jgi:hypothetical protein